MTALAPGGRHSWTSSFLGVGRLLAVTVQHSLALSLVERPVGPEHGALNTQLRVHLTVFMLCN